MSTMAVSFDEAALPAGATEELAGPPVQRFAPVTRNERVDALDVLRGVALMGILITHITSFGLAKWAYYVPLGTWLPVFSGPHAAENTVAWMLRWIFVEGKLRALFSMLFGAGAVLLTKRATRRGGGDQVADIFLRRHMWLVLIGALHGYLIWYGDTLFLYGITGLLFLYPLRKLQPRTLMKTAGWLLLAWLLFAGAGLSLSTYLIQKKGSNAIAAAHAGRVLTQEQRNDLDAKLRQDGNWWHSRQAVEQDIAEHKSYLQSLRADAKDEYLSSLAVYFVFPDVLIYMLLGMALYKTGFLTGRQSRVVYVKTAVFGFLVSVPLGTAAVIQSWRSGFEIVCTQTWLSLSYDICRASGAPATAAVVMLVLRAGIFRWITCRIAAVGQMALSNYILTSLVCRFLFVWGPTHWYGHIPYYRLYWVAAGVWGINLTWSTWWLRNFQFGPLEWVWRSLTYWHKQPMRVPANVAIT